METITKSSEINLIKSGLIKLTIIDNDLPIDEILKEYDNIYLYETDCGNEIYTVDGLDELDSEKLEHFNFYIKDYFYYGYPYYKDQEDEMSDCEIAFENGSACLTTFDKICL